MRARRTCGGKIRNPENPDEVRMCPEIATRDDGLCDEHREIYEEKRGTAARRGYDGKHRRWREGAIRRAIGKPCPLCGEIIVSSDAENGGLEAEHSTPLVQDRTSRADRIVHARCNPRGGAGSR